MKGIALQLSSKQKHHFILNHDKSYSFMLAEFSGPKSLSWSFRNSEDKTYQDGRRELWLQ
jgi:hypothetical protein